MFGLLKSPFGMITNRLRKSPGMIEFSHADQNLVLGLVVGLLVAAYFTNVLGYLRGPLLDKSVDSSPISLVLAMISVLIFSGLFLRITLFSKRLTLRSGVLTLFDYWPIPFLSLTTRSSEIESFTMTTTFSSFSRKAYIFLTVKTNGKRRLNQVYACKRVDLNLLLDDFALALRENGFDVRVNNENTMHLT